MAWAEKMDLQVEFTSSPYLWSSLPLWRGQLGHRGPSGKCVCSHQGAQHTDKTDLWLGYAGAQGGSGPADRTEVEPRALTPSLGLRTLEGVKGSQQRHLL